MVLMMNLYKDHDYLDHGDAGRGHYILMLRELENENIMIYNKKRTNYRLRCFAAAGTS